MSEVTNETGAKPLEAAAPSAEGTAKKSAPAKVRKALALLTRHPLGLVVAAGAAVALVEIELAVGILTGIGATALLATKSGPDARQEVLSKGQEVLTKSKAAVERARVKLASRAKARGAEAPTTETAAAQAATTAEGPASDPVTIPNRAPTPQADVAAAPAEEPPPTAAS